MRHFSRRDRAFIQKVCDAFDATLMGLKCEVKACTRPAYGRWIRLGFRGFYRTWCAHHWADYRCLTFAQKRDWVSAPECVKPDRLRP